MASGGSMSLRSGWAWYTIFVLLCLLMFQIIWFIGTTTLRDYERLQKEFLQATDEIARINTAAQSGGAAASDTTQTLISPLQKKLEFLQPQMDSALAAIKTWNPIWRWIVFWSKVSTSSGSSTDDNGELRSANGATQVLGLYILPLMYGWLGALLWVVQKLRDDDSEDAVKRLKPSSRVVTGMVAGPMIGMFLSPEFLNSLAFQATPFLIAFIGGYSTDVFFALIDRFLRFFRDALDKSAKPDSPLAKVPPNQQPAPPAITPGAGPKPSGG